MKKIPIIILTGPTAVGKTNLSIDLAKELNAEIISADSMQIYKYMDIGSAKITIDEMQGVKHYLVDEVTPDYVFSVSEFQKRADDYIQKINKDNKKVLVTGGTGLYLNSLIYNMDFAKSDANNELREKLRIELEENGIDYMHNKLKELDPEAAQRIHKNNTKRVIRALEVCLSGEKMNDFSKDLKFNEKYINDIHERGKRVLVTGGTGLYLNSLIYNMDFAKSDANNEIREKLEKELEENGIDYMHEKLRSLDEDAANRIHKNNTKRVIRAIEVCLSGNKMNDFSKDLRYNEKYKPIIIVLNREREHLYERINKRVDIMMDNGLIDEVKNLLKMGYTKDMISMQGIGYKEIIKYLDGEYTLDEAIDIIKRDSRRYAKRQLTWFRRYDDAKWFNLDEYSDSQVLKNDIIMHIEKML